MIKKIVKYEVGGRAFDTEAAAKKEEIKVIFNDMVKKAEATDYAEDGVLVVLQSLISLPGISRAKLQKIMEAADDNHTKG